MDSVERQKLDIEIPSTSASSNETIVSSNESIQHSEFHFLMLDNYCILEIMERLRLHDLCSISSTCKRLRKLSKIVFCHQYRSKAKKIKNLEENGMIMYEDAKEYIKCFSKMPNIILDISHADLANIQKLKSDFQIKPNGIKKVMFIEWGTMHPEYGKNLADLLKNTTSVIFSHMGIERGLFECILKHLPSMEQLILRRTLFQYNCDWLSKEYPKLKYFAWHFDEEVKVTNDFVKFFQQNPQIEKFSLLSRKIETIQQCVDNGININELFFEINEDGDEDAMTSLKYLHKFCAGDTSKRLHLLFDEFRLKYDLNRHFEYLLELEPNIDGLYFGDHTISKSHAKIINKFKQLKVIQIKLSKNVMLLTDLPNLEEIYFEGSVRILFEEKQNILSTFVSQSIKLKKLFIREYNKKLKLDLFDETRKKLESKTDLAIYFKKANFKKVKRDYDTFIIKIVGIGDIDKPLVSEIYDL